MAKNMNTEPLTYSELTALSRQLMDLGGALRNGTVTGRDAYQTVERIAEAINDHAINVMISETKGA